ncbi:MAG: BspA family leucine-rich repeat surface protein [Firmicutes bacterium]|nr:BspA family leucine-rich repeat surface protein [Bacillota bacterium]
MKNKYKIILIICVIIGICSILVGSIAYYRIVVEGSIKASTGNAVFVLKDENSNVWNNKEINLGKVNPGDSGSFTVTMDASGSTVDMYATLELDRGTLPTNLKFYTTSDHKSELHKYYSFLEHSGTNSETLTIYWYWNPYISDEEDSKFINVSNLEAKIRVSAVQISEYAYMKNENSDRSEFWSDTYRPYIRTINFGNDLSNLPSNCTLENLCFDVTGDGSKKKVYGYLVDSGLKDSSDLTKPLYNLYIVSETPIFAPSGCNGMFMGFKNLLQINFDDNFNTSNVTDMSSMFSDCSSLTSLDLSGFNTSNVTNMSWMFYNSSSLTNLNLSSFNTSNVTDMSSMFYWCSSLTSLGINSFNTSNVTNMNSMFHFCSSLTSLNVSSFNTSKVNNIIHMFQCCSSLTSLDLNGFNTSNVTDMSYMFSSCSSLTSLNLSSFNTSNVTDMSGMFSVCSSLTKLNLINFNTLQVTSMEQMFYGCSSLTSLDLSSFNTSNVSKFGGSGTNHGMFAGCSKLTTTINIIRSSVTDYQHMFYNAATDPNAKITVNYIAAASTLVDNMIATKSSNSNVVKGTEL